MKELSKPFGQVGKVEIACFKEENLQNLCRGFAHIEIIFLSIYEQNHCISLYNGGKWKGQHIRVEIAHPGFREKRIIEACDSQVSDS